MAIRVVDHHCKPRGASPDRIDDILGSTGKGAVADCIAGLYRERATRGPSCAWSAEIWMKSSISAWIESAPTLLAAAGQHR